MSTSPERTRSTGGTAAHAPANPPARRDADAWTRLHERIGDDFSAWAYASRRGGAWSVSVPAFSITAEDASAEAAFARATALLIDHLIARLDRDPVRLPALRRRPRLARLGFVVTVFVAEAIGRVRRRPPSVQRVLLTSRSLDLLARRTGAALTRRLEAIRNAEHRTTPIVAEKPRAPTRRRLVIFHRPRRPGSPALRGGSST